MQSPPGFADVLQPQQRWDVINFVRARAAGILSQDTAPRITAAAAYPVADFAFEWNGVQSTLRRVLENGPVLLVLYHGAPPIDRLQQLATAQTSLVSSGLHVIAVSLGSPSPAKEPPPLGVDVASEVKPVLALFVAPTDGGETELLLDRNGNVRARWTSSGGGLPDERTLVADAARANQFAVAAPSHAGHAQ